MNHIYDNIKESRKLERDNRAIGKFWDHCCSTGFLQADHPGRGKNPVGIYGDDCRYNKTGEKLVALNFNCILQEPRSIWMGLNRIFDVFGTFFWLMVDGSSTLATIPTKHIDRPIRPGYVQIPGLCATKQPDDPRVHIGACVSCAGLELQGF